MCSTPKATMNATAARYAYGTKAFQGVRLLALRFLNSDSCMSGASARAAKTEPPLTPCTLPLYSVLPLPCGVSNTGKHTTVGRPQLSHNSRKLLTCSSEPTRHVLALDRSVCGISAVYCVSGCRRERSESWGWPVQSITPILACCTLHIGTLCCT
jgi:hypothetical protein